MEAKEERKKEEGGREAWKRMQDMVQREEKRERKGNEEKGKKWDERKESDGKERTRKN